MMPDVSGFDVVAALQRNAETARIPVLLVTAKQITALEHAVLNKIPGKVSAGRAAIDRFVHSLVDYAHGRAPEKGSGGDDEERGGD